MEVGELKPGFDDAEGVCEDGTGGSGQTGEQKVIEGWLVFFLEVP